MSVNFLGHTLSDGNSEFQELQIKASSEAKPKLKPLPMKKPMPTSKRKSLYTATELLNMGIVEVPKLWAPFFPTTGVVGLTGSSDCGKSILLRQMAITIALGEEDFLGYPLNIKHRSALYVCTEDDFEGIAALLNRQVGELDPERLSNLHFIFESRDLLKQVDEFLSTTSVDFVVLDVWSDTYTGNPNNWVDVRQNLLNIKELAEKHDCLIAILHHTVKNSEKQAPDKAKLNGSQAIEAKLRCLLELRNGEADDERIMYVLKANSMSRKEKADGLILELHPERLLLTNTNKIISKNSTTKNNDGSKYDHALWMGRIQSLRTEGLSYDAIREVLAKNHPDEIVPSKGWIMNNKPEEVSQKEHKKE